ncbi:alpha-L-rhamnosidase-related protein [Edaphobacter acidisoli]|uniref:alpha-L-rhamnosidase-related protein n=1 Tax=Edaphobacter acidisoli TaxID=2040573 RepID=UPI001664BAD1|nr:alpha-L-rhamnosidase C-terminal domain-containing protein [Edaphobacter acidisoli]
MIRRLLICSFALVSAISLPAQSAIPNGQLDPTRSLAAATQPHTPLPEEYVWTAGDVTTQRPDRSKFSWSRADLRAEPHYFRTSFDLAAVPAAATLYIGGPRQARVWINGQLVMSFNKDTDAPINFRVFHAGAARALKPGKNTIAIEAVRGRGVVTGMPSLPLAQLAYGEVLVAKIVPAAFGVEAPALVITNKEWRSSAVRSEGWESPGFDDNAWPAVESLGPVESNVDFFQWSADAGMYGWPGYRGMSADLRTYSLLPAAVTHVYTAESQLTNVDSLTTASAPAPFTVTLANTPPDAEAPTLLLDFGREVSGRLLVESGCNCTATLSIAYGESEIEAMSTGLTTGQRGGNYLGTNLVAVPPNGVARGPKSAFRYVRISFLRGAPVTAFKAMRVEGIYYPVRYEGTFESSDPVLNRIWETAAYTAHLCMQDGVWDAPKRDRGRWVGDLDVTGRTISTVFGAPAAIEDTLNRLVVPTSKAPVNGIPGYSALWVTSLYSLNLHSGDKKFLESQHANLLHVLGVMDAGVDADGMLENTKRGWGFVDWAPGYYGGTQETRVGTELEYIRAYGDAAELLTEIGDTANAEKYSAIARKATAAAEAQFRDPVGAYGKSWQLNSLAVLAKAAPDSSAIWNESLSHVKQDSPSDQPITPYSNAWVLDAMSATGHPQEALDWMRKYWGGMLAEGATSFWENYDLRWPKAEFHLSLQADGTSGYFVSLSHGWSSAPAAWLAENVLGIVPTSPGYRTVDIQPELLGLEWARGSVATPHGPIKVSIEKEKGIHVDLPTGVEKARVRVEGATGSVLVNGHETALADGYLVLTSPGQYDVTARNRPQ